MKFQIEHELNSFDTQGVLQRSLALNYDDSDHTETVERWLDNPEEAKAEVEPGLKQRGAPRGAAIFELRGERLKYIAAVAPKVIALDKPEPQNSPE